MAAAAAAATAEIGAAVIATSSEMEATATAVTTPAAAAAAATAEIGAAVTATSSETEATATPITTAAAAAAAGPPPAIPEKCMHKGRLQTFAHRTYKKPPTYKVECEGDFHHPKFRCTVEVGGKQFSSVGCFDRKKEAEQDAARVAYEVLAAVGEDEIKEAFGLIDQDAVFCKSILYEFAVKTKTTWPSYSLVYLKKPLTLFAAIVVFDGNSYTGETACTKKDAEQNAARAVIKSILAKHNTCMVGIVRSKKHLITAVRSSGSAPATFTPIQFTRAVSYAPYGEPDHVAPVLQNESSSLALPGGTNAVPAVGTSANPSSANVACSRKRKGGVEGPGINETRVAKGH